VAGLTDKVKAYFIKVLATEYGSNSVVEVGSPIGSFSAPIFLVELDRVDIRGDKVVVVMRATATCQTASREEADEKTSGLLVDVIQRVVAYVEKGWPVIDGKGPPWLPPAEVESTIDDKSNPAQVKISWLFHFTTGRYIGGVV